MKRKAAIIAYDVAKTQRRKRLCRKLKQWSLDGQYSVFECLLTTREATELFLDLAAEIDNNTDRLLLAWLDNRRQSYSLLDRQQLNFQVPSVYTHSLTIVTLRRLKGQ